MLSAQGDDPSLAPCLGNAGGGEFGAYEMCPSGYAFVANNNYSAKFEGRPEDITINGSCCSMPFPDILTDEHLYNVKEECPEDSVITSGGGSGCISDCNVRCTRINTQKYKLGPLRQSLFWRSSGTFGLRSGQGLAKQILWEMIPPGIRLAIGRTAQSSWAQDGCIGDPFGSLLVAKKNYSCDGFYYRQLLYRDGTPVKMFPRCDSLSSAYTDAKCLKN